MIIEAFHLLPRRFVQIDNTPPPRLSVIYPEPGAPPPAPGFFRLDGRGGLSRFSTCPNAFGPPFLTIRTMREFEGVCQVSASGV
jgi:hypothetical protein